MKKVCTSSFSETFKIKLFLFLSQVLSTIELILTRKSKKHLFLNNKSFDQNFVFLAQSVKCSQAEFIIFSILKHYGPKFLKFELRNCQNLSIYYESRLKIPLWADFSKTAR
jgi:hypothetical protein